ncbi:mannose-6-phosphate isomerase [Catalinimonas alkaloidigena]|uniref:type I phosphomannose isomerase catalytic subunit n=1 Tax=Catalinimonas alkaloidigena TaxID=1075417 RepID=UPI00240541D2|nr:type I phosphomannose isomerase catalytic subunit [Catalinimonas alkaloidigena]MDF9801013.1 mannose-6-phosphate isomerase [Catalinimonas alkaloidigena]
MTKLYPLKFRTIFKDKIWGGKKIKTILDKDFSPLPNCGETWEISGVEGNISEVAEGALAGKNLKELIQQYQGKLVGERVYTKFQDEFPLLVKFIDANDDLSIQVHPDDALAKQRHNSFGKTEMWYIFQADEGSKLISGFNQPMSKEKYLEAFNSGKLTEILNQEPVKADDVFFLPAGRVHTIGKGLLLAEIQQTSDITYRIYDFDRTDAQGNKRELHVEEALDAIDYQHYDDYKTKYEPKLNEAVRLASCPYFETYRIEADQTMERNYQGLDSFVIYVCMEGEAEIIADGKGYSVKKGDSYLVPASIQHTKLTTSSKFKMLESYVPQ